MTQPVYTCRLNDTLNTAAKLMWEHDLGAVPIVNDDGRVVGMITDRDICMAVYTTGHSFHTMEVSRAMSDDVFSCSEEDTVEEAELLMSDKQIRRVPVVDGENRPIGMLSLNDIARHATLTPAKKGINRDLVQTLAAISQPRSSRTLEAQAQ